MLVEIVKPQKEGRFHEPSKDYFHNETLDLGILVPESMVKMWKSTSDKIEDKLEELREDTEILKASYKEIIEYINFSLGSMSSSQFNSNAKENKKLLLESYSKKDNLHKWAKHGQIR